MDPLRTRCRSLLARTATALAAVAFIASCGADSEPAGADGEPTTTETPRTVPAVTAGALRAAVPPPDEPRADAVEHEVLLYGDSVAVLIADDLATEIDAPLLVDAVDCRRLDAGFTGPCGGVPAGLAVASGLDDLADVVELLDEPSTAAAVVVIANNAALQAEDLDRAMAALDPLPRVWWVTARVEGRGWQDPNNRLLDELVQRDPRAGIVDWFATSEGRALLVDNVHPGDEGQAALADLIADHLRCDCTP